MIAAFAVFGLVIYRRAVYLNLARREIALKVLHVGLRVPQAPFDEAEQLHVLGAVRTVGQGETAHLGIGLQRVEEQGGAFQAVLDARDTRIAKAMTALVLVQGSLARLPRRVPGHIAILDVEVAAAGVHRHTVVTVARQTAEFCILVEAIASGKVGDQRKEILVAQIVDPRPGCDRIRDDVFARGVVEISEFHICSVLLASFLKKYIRQGRRCTSDLVLQTQSHSGLFD